MLAETDARQHIPDPSIGWLRSDEDGNVRFDAGRSPKQTGSFRPLYLWAFLKARPVPAVSPSAILAEGERQWDIRHSIR